MAIRSYWLFVCNLASSDPRNSSAVAPERCAAILSTWVSMGLIKADTTLRSGMSVEQELCVGQNVPSDG